MSAAISMCKFSERSSKCKIIFRHCKKMNYAIILIHRHFFIVLMLNTCFFSLLL